MGEIPTTSQIQLPSGEGGEFYDRGHGAAITLRYITVPVFQYITISILHAAATSSHFYKNGLVSLCTDSYTNVTVNLAKSKTKSNLLRCLPSF